MKTYCHCGGRYDLIRHRWYGQQRHHECDAASVSPRL